MHANNLKYALTLLISSSHHPNPYIPTTFFIKPIYKSSYTFPHLALYSRPLLPCHLLLPSIPLISFSLHLLPTSSTPPPPLTPSPYPRLKVASSFRTRVTSPTPPNPHTPTLPLTPPP